MREFHVPYQDGAEADLLRIVEASSDRSTASDDLAARSYDWPTHYHLSRQRANVVRPVRVREGARVLDVGAGTGVISRYLAEQGAEVVALEGNPDRADVISARCHDLPGVTVVTGALDTFDDPDGFDLVLVIGVLEYASDATGGAAGAAGFLERARALTRPAGAVAVAIENQLGLKYVLGYAEDHLGLPWVGVEGYPTPSGIRTYSRRALQGLLDDAGLTAQRWLYPFPDYKLPRVVLAERAYGEPDALDLVDQLVGRPSSEAGTPPTVVCDDRGAHRSFVAAGLGPDVANSFLVVASAEAGPLDDLVEPDVLAWHFGSERRRRWLRTRTVRERTEGRVVEAQRLEPGGAGPAAAGWLRQHVPDAVPYTPGPTVEQLARAACARRDQSAVKDVLRAWREHLRSEERPASEGDRSPGRPFVRDETVTVLPGDHLDVSLANFVAAGDDLVYVDREWEVDGGVDAEIACTRALWYFASDLVTTGAPHPWPRSTSVDEMVVALGDLAGVDVTAALLDAWRHAEAALQEEVIGADPEADLHRRLEVGRSRVTDAAVAANLPLGRLAGALAEAHRSEVGQEKMQRVIARLTEQLEEWRGELTATHEALQAAESRAAAAEAEVGHWRARWERVERLWPVKAVRRMVGRPYQG